MVEKPWHANFPSPKAELRSVAHDEVAKMISDPSQVAGKDYVVVDVRRTDFAVPLSLLPQTPESDLPPFPILLENIVPLISCRSLTLTNCRAQLSRE
jgi:hypothetical protein